MTTTLSPTFMIDGQPYRTCATCDGDGHATIDGDPFCTTCFGTGHEPVFTEVEEMRMRFHKANAGGATAGSFPGHASFTPGQGGSGRRCSTSKVRSNKYPGKCYKCGGWVDAQAGEIVRDNDGTWLVRHPLTRCPEAKAAEPEVRTNRRPGPCHICHQTVAIGEGKVFKSNGLWFVEHLNGCPAPEQDSIDLSDLPSGRYAVPNGDTRLKVQVKHGTDKWDGWIFVSDGAHYGDRTNYGSQRPGSTYQGKIREQLKAILADPREAMVAYGHLTGTCGRCGRILEDEQSVALGVGPVCAGKLGW